MRAPYRKGVFSIKSAYLVDQADRFKDHGMLTPAERSTKSEQLELTKEAKGEQSYLKSRSNEGKRVGRLANRLDRVGRLFK